MAEEEKSFGRKLLGFFIEESPQQTQPTITPTAAPKNQPQMQETVFVKNASGTG